MYLFARHMLPASFHLACWVYRCYQQIDGNFHFFSPAKVILKSRGQVAAGLSVTRSFGVRISGVVTAGDGRTNSTPAER